MRFRVVWFSKLQRYLYPRRTISIQSDAQYQYMNEEICFLVNEQDQPIGTASKKVCHEIRTGQPPPLHRAFSLFLFAQFGNTVVGSHNLRLLMQQRAPSKLTFPGLWSNTCCSHPLSNVPGEDEHHNALGIKRASQRKVLHELGIKPNQHLPLEDIHFLTRILYYAPNSKTASPRWAEHEVDAILVSVLHPNSEKTLNSELIQCNPDEVSATRWISRSELDSLRDPQIPFPSSAPAMSLTDLTPWFRALVTTGLLHRLWNWVEAYTTRQSDATRFHIEDQRWDRHVIQRLSAS